MSMYGKQLGTKQWLEECLHMFIVTEYIIAQPTPASLTSRIGLKHEAKENYFEALESYIDARIEEKLGAKYGKKVA